MNNLFHHTYKKIKQNFFKIITLNLHIPLQRHKKQIELTLQINPLQIITQNA